jgi:hypothetical protein
MSRNYFLTENDPITRQHVPEEFENDNEIIVSRPSPSNNDKSVMTSARFNHDEYSKDSAAFKLSRTFASTNAGSTTDNLPYYDVLTSVESTASLSQQRRSNAIKKRWANPEYRKRWYARRWGDRGFNEKDQEQIRRYRKAEALARDLPKGFLGSPELASLTKEEITEAIATRVISNERRARSRKKSLQDRKETLAESNASIFNGVEEQVRTETHEWTRKDTSHKLDPNSLFVCTHEEMTEAQQRRSERAKKTYQTRMENERARQKARAEYVPTHPAFIVPVIQETSPLDRPFYPPKQLTPRDALLRVEHALDKEKLPDIDDVRLILQPKRLAHRKDVLFRVLKDGFDLCGKCVPVYDTKVQAEEKVPLTYEFATHSSIQMLGNFVLSLLMTKNK